MASISLEKILTTALGTVGYNLLGLICFIGLGAILYKWAVADDCHSQTTLKVAEEIVAEEENELDEVEDKQK